MNRKQKTEKFALNAILYVVVFFLLAVFTMSAQAQVVTEEKIKKVRPKNNIFKSIYKEVFKYGTFYIAGDARSSNVPERLDYFIRTNPDDLYDVPQVIDETIYHPFDYRYGFGFRKLARFGYEMKAKHYYDGLENNKSLSAPTAAVKGFEYLLHWEKERERGLVFTNSRYFIRHTGNYHIIKLEQRERGNLDFKYQSAEARLRLPIGKKFSISAGAIFRTHERAYGYNPIEIWLNESETWTNPQTGEIIEYPANPWYSLGYQYGFTDEPTTFTNEATGEEFFDWIWRDPDGNIVAYGDRDFRDRVFGDLMNRYNNEIFDQLDGYGEIAPIVGFDFYHYKRNFWLHAYGSWILPHHKYVMGDEDFSYLNRNNWGLGGLREDSSPEQWSDYQGGIIFGWKISKNLGFFFEGEYTKFWDSELFMSSAGINIRL